MFDGTPYKDLLTEFPVILSIQLQIDVTETNSPSISEIFYTPHAPPSK